MRFIFAFFWVILLIAEWRCWLNWHIGYFRIGLPILIKKIPSTNKHLSIAKNIVLSDETNERKIGKITLRKLSETEVAVRNKYFLLLPVRGRLIFNANHSVIKIQILIDWFMIVLLFYILAIAIWSEGPSNPVADILGLIGGSLMVYIMLIESFMAFIKNKK